MPLIALLTDFGLSDHYVGVMKGVIFGLCPDARIIDITHQIAPQDLYGAAYTLFSAYRYFPKETVHVVVVDPGVGGARRIVAARTSHGIFVAPDNGVLWPVLANERVVSLVSVENPEFFMHPVSRTFHGRDIFAPVAAKIARGIDIDRLGPRIGTEQLVRLEFAETGIGADGALEGTIIAVDRFGNLITSIRRREIETVYGAEAGGSLAIVFDDGKRIEGLSETYDAVEEGVPLAIIGSGGMLEISVNRGNAGAYFKKRPGHRVRLLPINPHG